MKFLGADVFQSIVSFFQTIREGIALEHLLYIFIGLELLTIIVFSVIVSFVYEVRLIRAVDKINSYLYEVQYITENNLIEFNNMMKKVPKTLRYHWQQFMLNRDKNPSYYMSVENCIDRPLKSSSFATNIKIVKSLGIVYAILSCVFTFGWASSLANVGGDFFITVLLIPLIILLLNYFFIVALNIKKNGTINELYQTFHIFNRFMDKAVSTMPNYVDFEVLFTEEEIRRGIPVLNEYIEKRQLQEQEEMRKARENAIQQELYDFEAAGEKGELVLERAMKETEIFVSMRTRLEAEVGQYEGEIESLKRNFENTTKDYQKKLQASKENIDRLREQQEATTNRIENNYIRKQQADEIKKQQQIEKDYEDAQLRYNQEINVIAEEIKKRKAELEEARVGVEKAMLAEYKTFADKIYSEIRKSVNEKVKEEREELINSRQEVYLELEKALSKIDTLEIQNKVLVNKSGEREAYLRAEIFKEKTELKQLLEAKNRIIEEKERQIEIISADYSRKFEKMRQKQQKAKDPVIVVEKPEEDEFAGHYDSEGNYRYKNGSFYDPYGNFHDENGNVFDKNGNLLVKGEEPEEENVFGGIEFEEFNFEPKQSEENLAEETVEELEMVEEPVVEEQPVDQPAEDLVEEKHDEPEIIEAEDKAEEAAPAPEKKKAGRPRKEKVEEVSQEPKRRGRPKKVETEEPKAEEPKKPRGRPRKIETEEQKAEEPKKPRGRPKKVETAEPKAEEPKRPRGRPKKEVSQVEEVAPKKPRGRPKKEMNIDENLKLIEERLKEQNELLKKQQKALDITVKKATKSDK